MKRADIEAAYDVRDGRIVSPGKFEGEPIWVPYFWDAYLNGMADSDDGDYIRFAVTDEDRAEFPELADVPAVGLREDDQGFVYGETFGEADPHVGQDDE